VRKAAEQGGVEGRPVRPLARPAFAALLLFVCAGALALYALREGSGRETARRPPAEQQPSVDQSADAVAALRMKDGRQNAGAAPAASNGSQTTTQNSFERGASETPPRSRAMSANTPPRGATTARAATPAPATRAGEPRRGAAPEQARAESNRGKAEPESAAGGMTSPRDADATRSVEPGSGAVALAKVRKVFIEVTGETDLGARTTRLLAGSLRAGGRLTPTDAKEEADAAFKIKVSGGSEAGAGRRPVTASVRLVNEDGEVIWPAVGRGRAGVYTGTVEDVTRRIAGDLLKDVLKSDARP
jgi:hypothetical protein